MVAIAVVGGTIIFVFSQGFFNQAQISGTPTIELVKIIGYDARDVPLLEAQDGRMMVVLSSATNVIKGKTVGERIITYVKNDSVGRILFSEIRLGGSIYTYYTTSPIPNYPATTAGQYGILTNSTHLITDQAAVVQPGQTVGFIFDLRDNFPIGRDTQFKLTTTNGAVFISTVVMGQNAG